jgi:hypothetical protein
MRKRITIKRREASVNLMSIAKAPHRERRHMVS